MQGSGPWSHILTEEMSKRTPLIIKSCIVIKIVRLTSGYSTNPSPHFWATKINQPMLQQSTGHRPKSDKLTFDMSADFLLANKSSQLVTPSWQQSRTTRTWSSVIPPSSIYRLQLDCIWTNVEPNIGFHLRPYSLHRSCMLSQNVYIEWVACKKLDICRHAFKGAKWIAIFIR